MAKILFALNGLHFQTLKKAPIEKLWDYFNFNKDIKEHLYLNPSAKFRLLGDNNRIIAELPRKGTTSSRQFFIERRCK